MTHGVPVENDQIAAKGGSNAAKPIVLVGLMGAGKSSVGRRLAAELDLPFYDSDDEIEKAADMTIPEIFAQHGEEEFRRGERRVLERLITQSQRVVLATGGGAYMDPVTRDLLRQHAVTVWLKADLDVLWKRVSKKGGRPLLEKPNPKKVLADLLQEREPIYAQADYIVETFEGPHADTVNAVRSALNI